jgi:hypothetical protein
MAQQKKRLVLKIVWGLKTQNGEINTRFDHARKEKSGLDESTKNTKPGRVF